MRVNFDDQFLVTAGKDGCLILFDIKVTIVNFRIKKLGEINWEMGSWDPLMKSWLQEEILKTLRLKRIILKINIKTTYKLKQILK